MFVLDVPGFGRIEAEFLVSDFTGTLSRDGVLIPGVAGRLKRLARFLELYVATFDTFGTAERQLRGLPCRVLRMSGEGAAEQKRDLVLRLGSGRTLALGNGANDRLMLATARLGIVVIEEEGASTAAIAAADVVVRDIACGLNLLLRPKRLLATLRS